jgi:CBS domain-containing membrane protein
MSGNHPPPPADPAFDEAGDAPIVDLLPELTESDVAEAMHDISGYLDISPQDFRELYRASATHALARLAGNPMGRSLMRVGGPTLAPHQYLPEAIARMANHGVKSAAVVDETQRVIGILTETDVLRQLEVSSSLDLLVLLFQDPAAVQHCCAKVRVDAVMTRPAQTLDADATLPAMVAAFRRHGGRSMPVVDESGRLLGMLGRKDLIRSCGLGGARP